MDRYGDDKVCGGEYITCGRAQKLCKDRQSVPVATAFEREDQPAGDIIIDKRRACLMPDGRMRRTGRTDKPVLLAALKGQGAAVAEWRADKVQLREFFRRKAGITGKGIPAYQRLSGVQPAEKAAKAFAVYA